MFVFSTSSNEKFYDKYTKFNKITTLNDIARETIKYNIGST